MKEEKSKLIRFDWAMKNILREKINFDILEGFLSALLNDDDIEVVELLESESNQENSIDKFNRVDLLVKYGHGRKIIIEIQNNYESSYLERVLFGSSKVIIENMEVGKKFKEVKKVISISIMYFNLGQGKDYLYHGKTEFKSLNDLDNLILKKRVYKKEEKKEKKKSFSLEEKNIFPEYYLIFVGRYKDIIKHNIDEWLFLFKNDRIKEDFSSKNISLCTEKLDLMKMSYAEKKTYDSYLINEAIREDLISSAEEKGKKEGKLEGKKSKSIGIR